MIKGCAKKVVVVRDINSSLFEEAFFIVKAGAGTQTRPGKESDYISEAHRIVRSDLPSSNKLISERNSSNSYIPAFDYRKTKAKKKRAFRDMMMFLSGFGISVVLCTVIYYSGIGL